jgi:hypothetical protein
LKKLFQSITELGIHLSIVIFDVILKVQKYVDFVAVADSKPEGCGF